MGGKTHQQKIGNYGEELAVEFLQQKGLQILERNFRAGHGEIDIIALDGNTLVFIEVKTSNSATFEHPAAWVDDKKQRLIGETAEAYLYRRNCQDYDCRFDIIAIQLGRTKAIIEHMKDAFWLES